MNVLIEGRCLAWDVSPVAPTPFGFLLLFCVCVCVCVVLQIYIVFTRGAPNKAVKNNNKKLHPSTSSKLVWLKRGSALELAKKVLTNNFIYSISEIGHRQRTSQNCSCYSLIFFLSVTG